MIEHMIVRARSRVFATTTLEARRSLRRDTTQTISPFHVPDKDGSGDIDIDELSGFLQMWSDHSFSLDETRIYLQLLTRTETENSRSRRF